MLRSKPALMISLFLIAVLASGLLVTAFPAVDRKDALFPQTIHQRQTPYFPDTPASCPICSQGYDGIDSCAAAAPVLANFSMVIFNPGAFIDVIKCACTDTFQSAYPQCVDCFIQTDQTQFLNDTSVDLPSLVTNIRNLCAVESTLLGNVTDTNGASTNTAASAASYNVLWGWSLVFALATSFIGAEYSI